MWAKFVQGQGGSDWDQITDIAVDGSGNVYTTGHFFGTVDFDPEAGAANLTSVGFLDVFVSKLDSAGSFMWAKAFGGTNEDRGLGVVVDSLGNVYTTGFFEGTADFDPGAGTANLTGAGSLDIFVSKLDSAGNFVWAKAFGGTGDDQGESIAVDAFGNVHTTGTFHNTVDFDPDPGTVNLTSVVGGQDIFVSKLLAVPAVLSILRTDADPTNASSVTFTVTFSEPVTGVDAGDFTIDAFDITGASITGISGSDATYTVTVNTGTGYGTLSIHLTDDDSITDSDTIPLGGTGANNGDFTTAQAYTIAPPIPAANRPALTLLALTLLAAGLSIVAHRDTKQQ